MKQRHLAILAAVAGITVLGGYIATRSRQPDPHWNAAKPPVGMDQSASAAAAKRVLLPGLKEKVTETAKVVIRSGLTTIELVKAPDSGAWVIASKANYTADGAAVRTLLAELANAYILEDKTSKPELYERIGVEDVTESGAMSVLVSLFDAKGASLGSVILGNPQTETGTPTSDAPTVAKRFVRREGEAQSFLAAIDSSVRAAVTAWAETTILEIPSERIKSAEFSVARAEGATAVTSMSRESTTQPTFAVANVPEGRSLKDQYGATRAAQSLSYLTFEDVRPANELAFDSPTVSTATFSTFDGLTITVKSVGDAGRTWHHFAAAFNPPAKVDPAPAPVVTAPAANAEASLDALTAAPAPATPPALTPEQQAEAEAKKQEEAEKHAALAAEAEAINARLGGWAFEVQEFKANQFRTTLDDLLAPPAAPAGESEAGAGAELQPSPK